MKKSLMAALLSGLIYPGVGQLWLRHYARGLALIVVVTAALTTIVAKASLDALHLLEKIEAEGGAVDLVAIVNLATTASLTSSNHILTKCATLVLVLGWLYGVVDAYLLGKRQELSGSTRKAPSGKGGGRP